MVYRAEPVPISKLIDEQVVSGTQLAKSHVPADKRDYWMTKLIIITLFTEMYLLQLQTFLLTPKLYQNTIYKLLKVHPPSPGPCNRFLSEGG